MSLVRFVRTYRGAQAVLALACRLPRPVAYTLSDWLLGFVACQAGTPYAQGVRSNLAVFLDLPPTHPDLVRTARDVFRNLGRGYVDFMRAGACGAQTVADCCHPSRSLRGQIEQAMAEGRGLVMVGAHMCGFDFELIAMKRWFPDLLVLGQAQPTGSSVLMNDLRRRLGLEIALISPGTLRDAVGVLRRGGMVGFAADVPVPDAEPLAFFGKPACLPTGHARLALSSDAEIALGVCHRAGPGCYELEGEVVPCPVTAHDQHRAAVEWAQACLRRLEVWLRRWPDEWFMPQPLWESGKALARPAEGRA
jgi:lauroyl/myristoyl acyltransferase